MSNRLEDLDDYASGAMSDDDANAFEEELFASAPADETLLFFDRTMRNAATMLRRGAWSVGSTRADVDRLRAENPRVAYFDLGDAGGETRLDTWSEGTEYVVVRVGVDLRNVTNVDVELEDPSAGPLKVFRDVHYDPNDLALYAVCEEPLARLAWRRPRVITRVIGVREGRRETIVEYVTLGETAG